jgi:acyl carrier protein
MDSLLPEVQETFHQVFDRDDLVITRESNASNVADWDSLTHINLVTALERKFKIKFALGELEELKNVGDLLDLIATKLNSKK